VRSPKAPLEVRVFIPSPAIGGWPAAHDTNPAHNNVKFAQRHLVAVRVMRCKMSLTSPESVITGARDGSAPNLRNDKKSG